MPAASGIVKAELNDIYRRNSRTTTLVLQKCVGRLDPISCVYEMHRNRSGFLRTDLSQTWRIIKRLVRRFAVLGSEAVNSLNRHSGFTLIEMAMVLLILGLLTRSLIQPLTSAKLHTQHRQTVHHLETIKQALLAYVVAHGALPCPLSIDNPRPGADDESDRPNCSNSLGGVPAAQLAMDGAVNESGALLDAWGRAYRYIVSSENHGTKGDVDSLDWTTATDASDIGLESMSASLVLSFSPKEKISIQALCKMKMLMTIISSC